MASPHPPIRLDESAAAPRISVALCTHNGAEFLPEQVRSICLQEPPPAEIVLSDDASRDGSIQVVRETVEACMRERPGLRIALVVLHNEVALRVTKNFQQAIAHCSGELIALSDQDDVWRPGRLARMLEAFERRPGLLLLHTDALLVDARGRSLGHTLFHALEVKPNETRRIHEGLAFDVFLRRNLVTGATCMFRRSLVPHAFPLPPEWIHDEWLGIVAAAVGEVDVIEEPWIDYRQHASNQIGARRDSFVGKVRKALASRGNTHVERAMKAEILHERLKTLGDLVAPETLEKVRAKVEHQRFRARLPGSRLARCIPVLQEAMTGRYDRFGRGFRGVVRDLFESV